MLLCQDLIFSRLGSSMHLWPIIASAVTLAVVASAQVPARTHSTLVLPIPGVPLSVETIEEYVTKSPDGTSSDEVEKTKVFRDVAGRMRFEMEISEPNDGPVKLIMLVDPVDGFMAVLETSTKIAHRLKSQTGSSAFAITMGGRGLIDVLGTKTNRTEALGKQTIDTIEYEGTRMTTTSDDQPSLVAVCDRWTAKELGLIGLVKNSGPDGTITSRIQNVDRTAPDPALFVIPADYHVRDLEFPSPVQ
jgi:hypothetical protein